MNYSNLPTSKERAEKVSSKFFFTNTPCKNGHISPKYTIGSRCVECNKNACAKRRSKIPREEYLSSKREEYERTKAACLERQRQYYHEHKAERTAYANDYKEKNSQKVRDYKKKWDEENREYMKTYLASTKERRDQNRKIWLKTNRWRLTASGGKRRAAKMDATPAWLSADQWEEIWAIYQKAWELTTDTGIKHHVDHSCPLQNDLICGLHVPWNLRIITATENMAKHNTFIEELALPTIH